MPPGQRRPIVSLDLWDLGCPFVRTNAPPLPLNSWTFGCGIDSEGVCCNGSDVCITGDTSFLLVISFSSVPAQEFRAVVVSVSLDREGSTLTRYAFLDCPAPITKTMIRGNLVLLQLNRTDVVLWDFMHSRGLRYCPTPEVSASNKHLMLTHDYVALLIGGGGEYEGIYVWDISRLDLNRLDANHPLTLAHCPTHSVQFSRWTPVPRAEAGGVVGSRALPCRPPNSLLFELIQGRDETSLTRFRVDLAKGSAPGSIETKLSALGTCSLPSIRRCAVPEQATGLCVVRPSSTKGRGRHCQLFAYEPAIMAEPALEPVRPPMPIPMGLGYPSASCAYSGRVLCTRPLYDKGNGASTYCADYLTDSERRWSKPAKALATSLTKLLRLT
ncbi:hypothetical protein FA13DRAFT_1794985 [Coprinellus micaceus]|uniref:Uncharacterized protein n=1 Tax=Coprinellus micaceus TaxID=71717 RepID=A0A4Y7SZ72_COPMI|nr:hypothetical protein FA13DRAFT_1794985 [Coprinellus micaceus]